MSEYGIVKGFQTETGVAIYDYDSLYNTPKVVKTINNLSPDDSGNIIINTEGEPGFSPIANVTSTEDGAIITVTDQTGTTEVLLPKGEKGNSGVYVGSGEMPEGYNVQIDPDGETSPIYEETYLENSKNLCTLGTITFVRGSGYLELGVTLEEGEVYTLSAFVTSTDTDIDYSSFYLATSNNSQQSQRYDLERNIRDSVTFTCPASANPINKIYFYAARNGTTSEGDTATIRNIQIEKGSVATEYMPPLSAKIPTAIDYIARGRNQDIEEKINSLLNKEQIFSTFSATDFEQGRIMESGNNATNSVRIRSTGFFPIKGSSEFEYIIKPNYRIYLVFFKENLYGTNIKFSGWLTGSGVYSVPSGTNYYRIQIASIDDSSELTPKDCSVVKIKNTYPLMSEFNDIVEKTKWLAIGDSITAGVHSYLVSESLTNLATLGTYLEGQYVKSGDGTLAQGSNYFSYANVPVQEGVVYNVPYCRNYAFYDAEGGVIKADNTIEDDGFTASTLMDVYLTAPIGATSFTASYRVSEISYEFVTIMNRQIEAQSAFGEGWVSCLAKSLGYDLTLMGCRGMGYTNSITGWDPDYNSSDHRISLDTLLSRIEVMEEHFNLITLAFGINDYATSSATLETILTGLGDAVERLMRKYPAARLVVITPFNSSRKGDATSNFAYNTAHGGKTLKEVAEAIQDYCKEQGIECIYATNGFLLNNFNITTLLPDNTHPSQEGHRLIAKNMARFLLN